MLFVIMVFVPDIVLEDSLGLDQEMVEELAIFLLGGTGFIFYLIKEKQLVRDREEKVKAQREASRMSKDLTSSYSFIGEINRKLEIFKNISLGLPVWSKKTMAREREVFEYIMASVKILTKADEYVLTFLDKNTCENLFELKSKKTLKLNATQEHCLEKNRKYFETDKLIVTVSPDDIGGIISMLVIKKKNPAHTFEDPDILKSIVSQALFLYVFTEKRRKRR